MHRSLSSSSASSAWSWSLPCALVWWYKSVEECTKKEHKRYRATIIRLLWHKSFAFRTLLLLLVSSSSSTYSCALHLGCMLHVQRRRLECNASFTIANLLYVFFLTCCFSAAPHPWTLGCKLQRRRFLEEQLLTTDEVKYTWRLLWSDAIVQCSGLAEEDGRKGAQRIVYRPFGLCWCFCCNGVSVKVNEMRSLLM